VYRNVALELVKHLTSSHLEEFPMRIWLAECLRPKDAELERSWRVLLQSLP